MGKGGQNEKESIHRDTGQMREGKEGQKGGISLHAQVSHLPTCYLKLFLLYNLAK